MKSSAFVDNYSQKRLFTVSESTQSAPETFLDAIKYWKVGTLIGKHTSGANGNINYQYLPGGIMVTFSGIKVINSDGTKHHLDGITPDYEVDYTLNDVLQKRDPFIEKALEIITK
ncbi:MULTISPECIES: S41 family peptidase [Sphingobacterium]|uniref:S41 family peptidase n=1 Tax=Sphingobacterium TaxID=28453 RepID=UPI0013DB4C4F|nr:MULTISPECIES: S41 family peptidase [unclassified Sphingobacterium]